VILSSISVSLVSLLGFLYIPGVSATIPGTFPDIPFSVFAQFIEDNFSHRITLTTVLVLLFSLTQNTELLNLHARQQNPQYTGERRQPITGWMKAFVWCMQAHLGTKTTHLFKSSDQSSGQDQSSLIAHKIDQMAKCLGLYPYNEYGEKHAWLTPISHTHLTAGVRFLCPTSVECMTASCQPRALLQVTRERDVPKIRLIEGSQSHSQAYVLTGWCPTCEVCKHTASYHTPN
jgi:hypothetical protein